MDKLQLPCPVAKPYRIVSGLNPARKITIDGVTTIKPHNGIDIAVPVGTDVRAIADGIVVFSDWELATNPKFGFGLYVKYRFVHNGQAFYSYNGHCNELLVKVNQKISKGQLIAKSGNTGHSSGPHLHFGVRGEDTDTFYDIGFTDEDNAQKVA